MKSIVFAILTCLLCTCALNSQSLEDIFSRANELYRAGKYADAVKEYEKISQQGYESEELYFNLGNANYRDGQLGKAILYFERAAILDPYDPDIQHNLKLCYLKTIDRIEPVPELFIIQWLRGIASLLMHETVITIFIISWILMFCSLTALYILVRGDLVRVTRMVFLFSSVIVIMSMAMLGIQSFRETSKDKAIITEQVLTAKSSPDSQSADVFVIHEGLKVKISDEVGDWIKVTLPDGKVGWILSAQCERI